MTSVDVILHVDRTEDIRNENDVIEYVESKCGKTKHSKRLCMYGIARLAGSNRINGNLEEWRRLVSILRKNYWS